MSSYYSYFPQAHPEQLAMDQLLGFQDNNDTCITEYPLFELLPPPDDDYYFSLSSELLPTQQFESYPYDQCQYPYPKRQKITYFADHDHYDYPDYYYYYTPPCSALDGHFIPNPPLLVLTAAESYYNHDHLPLPDFTTPPVYNRGLIKTVVDDGEKADGGGKGLSVQSVAARQRRRKISEKTQELGKLIPGGHKMNTAEMFQAAFKYVKYLQAQVGILESMGCIQDQNAEQFTSSSSSEELQAVLVASPRIQEKLYSSAEKCVVPRQFVEAVANDLKLQSNTLVLQELEQFVKTSG